MNSKYNLSISFLILANLLPIIGVLFFNWSMFQVMFLYWFESGIIGFFHMLKILIRTRPIILGIIVSILFGVYFSPFMCVHLLFITGLFSDYTIDMIPFASITYPAMTLFISHLVSFIHNFIGKKEYKENNILTINIFDPFKRIVLMQFVLIFGGMIMMIFSKPILGIALLIIVKTIVDIDAHLKSHGQNGLKSIL